MYILLIFFNINKNANHKLKIIYIPVIKKKIIYIPNPN